MELESVLFVLFILFLNGISLVVMFGVPILLYKRWVENRNAPVYPLEQILAGLPGPVICPKCRRAMQPGVYSAQLVWSEKQKGRFSYSRPRWRWIRKTWGPRKASPWFACWHCDACKTFFVDYASRIALSGPTRNGQRVGGFQGKS